MNIPSSNSKLKEMASHEGIIFYNVRNTGMVKEAE